MKNLVIISPFQFRLQRGVERFNYYLANQLVKAYNIRITFFVWDYPKRINWGKWDHKIKFKFVPYSRYFQVYFARIFYWKWLSLKRPDVYLINFMYHGESILPKTSKILYVLHSPASLIPSRYEFIASVYMKFNSLTFISVSKSVKDASKQYFNSNSNFVVHHGLDFSEINRKSYYEQKGKLKILTVAALESWKGIQHVISVFKECEIKRNFEYHIIGAGPHYNDLYQDVIKNNAEDSVSFLGLKNNVHSLYSNYDIYCQLSDGEAFGLSVIEAMGAGLPTIVYNVPPFDYLFPPGKVIKIEKDYNEQLKLELFHLLSSKNRQKLGLEGQKFVLKTFTKEKMADEYFEIINMV